MSANKNINPEFAKGALFGSLIGDAAGATLEFLRRKPTSDEVQQALQMKGGGVFKLAPGQITDDGEMSLALCRALSGESEFLPNDVARAYRYWYLSEPFDIGFATSSALAEGNVDNKNLAAICSNNARQYNSESKANGCLMRVTPLGIWSARVDIKTATEASRMDTQLTHPNETCQLATAAYIVAIRHLMLHHGDSKGAFDAAESVVPSDPLNEARHFLNQAKAGKLPDGHPHAGFIGIAFTHAFYHLHRGSDFIDALTQVLSYGGDTDTNACIVGGLIGALHGLNGLPEYMCHAIQNCEVSHGRPRPEWLQSKHADQLSLRLIG